MLFYEVISRRACPCRVYLTDLLRQLRRAFTLPSELTYLTLVIRRVLTTLMRPMTTRRSYQNLHTQETMTRYGWDQDEKEAEGSLQSEASLKFCK